MVTGHPNAFSLGGNSGPSPGSGCTIGPHNSLIIKMMHEDCPRKANSGQVLAPGPALLPWAKV